MPRTKEFNETEALQKAVHLFWEKGYQGTSMEDLTIGLGLSRSSLYDTFGSKKELLMSCLQQYTTQSRQGIQNIMTLPLKGMEKVQLLVKNVIEAFITDAQQKGCFVVNIATELANQDVEIHTFTQNNIEIVKNIFLQIMEMGQKDGSIAHLHSAEDLAYHLFNIYNGLQVSGKMGANQEILWRMWDINKTLFEQA
jgi:TetR/AcrR family transcriptional repressor of nem operon